MSGTTTAKNNDAGNVDVENNYADNSNGQNAVAENGHIPVRSRGRPRPRVATLGDFVKIGNKFTALQEPDDPLDSKDVIQV